MAARNGNANRQIDNPKAENVTASNRMITNDKLFNGFDERDIRAMCLFGWEDLKMGTALSSLYLGVIRSIRNMNLEILRCLEEARYEYKLFINLP